MTVWTTEELAAIPDWPTLTSLDGHGVGYVFRFRGNLLWFTEQWTSDEEIEEALFSEEKREALLAAMPARKAEAQKRALERVHVFMAGEAQ